MKDNLRDWIVKQVDEISVSKASKAPEVPEVHSEPEGMTMVFYDAVSKSEEELQEEQFQDFVRDCIYSPLLFTGESKRTAVDIKEGSKCCTDISAASPNQSFSLTHASSRAVRQALIGGKFVVALVILSWAILNHPSSGPVTISCKAMQIVLANTKRGTQTVFAKTTRGTQTVLAKAASGTQAVLTKAASGTQIVLAKTANRSQIVLSKAASEMQVVLAKAASETQMIAPIVIHHMACFTSTVLIVTLWEFIVNVVWPSQLEPLEICPETEADEALECAEAGMATASSTSLDESCSEDKSVSSSIESLPSVTAKSLASTAALSEEDSLSRESYKSDKSDSSSSCNDSANDDMSSLSSFESSSIPKASTKTMDAVLSLPCKQLTFATKGPSRFRNALKRQDIVSKWNKFADMEREGLRAAPRYSTKVSKTGSRAPEYMQF